MVLTLRSIFAGGSASGFNARRRATLVPNNGFVYFSVSGISPPVLSYSLISSGISFLRYAGPEGAKNLAAENVLRLIQVRLATPSFGKISLTSQDNSPPARIADSSVFS